MGRVRRRIEKFDKTYKGPEGNTILLISSRSTSVEVKTYNYIVDWLKSDSILNT